MAVTYLIQGQAGEGHVEDIRKGLAFLARHTFQGAIRYEYYQSSEDPTIFYLFSIWESEADFQNYLTSAIHEEYLKMLPEDSWAEGRKRTTLQAL